MPLIEKITIGNSTIGVWELKETADDLLQICNLNLADTGRLETFKAEKLRKEFLGSRLLLQTLLPQCSEIIYQEKSGKQSLNDSNLNISISHSADLAAIILSEKNIGIDIEQPPLTIARRWAIPDYFIAAPVKRRVTGKLVPGRNFSGASELRSFHQ